jgi:hypothetical protein
VICDYGEVLSVVYLVEGSHSYLSTVAALPWRHYASITTFFYYASEIQSFFEPITGGNLT